jgi:hypothetical protein
VGIKNYPKERFYLKLPRGVAELLNQAILKSKGNFLPTGLCLKIFKARTILA